jgi:hypothetical protein
MPTVGVGVPHVGCAGDAAAFVVLAAAVDLSQPPTTLTELPLRTRVSPSPQVISI